MWKTNRLQVPTFCPLPSCRKDENTGTHLSLHALQPRLRPGGRRLGSGKRDAEGGIRGHEHPAGAVEAVDLTYFSGKGVSSP